MLADVVNSSACTAAEVFLSVNTWSLPSLNTNVSFVVADVKLSLIKFTNLVSLSNSLS